MGTAAERGKKIKVLHVITRFILGGAQENTYLTVKYQSLDENFDVSICTGPPLGPEGSMMDELSGVENVNVFLVGELRREINPWLDMVSFFRIYLLIKRGGYDLIHTHSSKAGILGRLAAGLAGKKAVVHTIHGLPFHPYQPGYLNAIYVWLERICALLTSRIITVCDAMRDKAAAAGVAGREKFRTVYSGMDLSAFTAAGSKSPELMKKLGIRYDDVVIGKIARLFPLKGHEYLVAAACGIVREYPNVKFLLVGDGILRDNILEKVRESGLEDKFIFAGLVRRDEIPSYVSVMDIVVHTSLREGLARVLPQALAAGKPAVSFDIDGAGEVVKDGVTGALVRPGDAAGIREAVLKLLHDPEGSRRMGMAGRELVLKRFDEKKMVADINRVYLEALEESGWMF